MENRYKTLDTIDCKTFSGGAMQIPPETVLTETEVYNEPLYYKLFSFDFNNSKSLVLLTLSEIFKRTEKL